MFSHTDTIGAPWWVVDADDKRTARLNCIAHLLATFPYEGVEVRIPDLPARPHGKNKYKRPPYELQRFVPDIY